MTKLRIVLLATSALTVTQLATFASHAQTAPLVVAQGTKEELGPDGKPKAPPKGAPPPAAAPQRPAPPPPPPAAAPPPRPTPPPAPPPHAPPPPAGRGGGRLPGRRARGAAAPAAPGAVPAAPGATPPPGRVQNTPPTVAPAFQRAPTVTAPLPPPPPALGTKALSAGAPAPGPRTMDQFRSERHEVQEGGRTVITEPGRVIIRDPGRPEYVRHNEEDRFRYGARDIRTETVGGETRTIVIRPDGTQIITV